MRDCLAIVDDEDEEHFDNQIDEEFHVWKRNAPYLYVDVCNCDRADMMSSCPTPSNGRAWRCNGFPDVSCRRPSRNSFLAAATGSTWNRRCICRHTLRRESRTTYCKWLSNSPSQTASLTCGNTTATAIVRGLPIRSQVANAGYTGLTGKVTEIVRINHDGEINKYL